MTEQYPEPTDDSVPDGTQLPIGGDDDEGQDQDAGVADDGTEEWYEEGDA